LCRERFGDAAALIGFGTHTAQVAASDWDEPMEVKDVRPSLDDSTSCNSILGGVSPCLVEGVRGADVVSNQT
jgi:hypothetical protein